MTETAVILAGGFGTRLQPVVNDLPKPMAPINGQPFLDYQLRYLRRNGISKAVISTGHLSGKIKDHYKDKFAGIEIRYSEEQSPMGTGGGIRMALEKCEEATVLVLNGDSFFDINLRSFFEMHKSHQGQASIALKKVENASRYGAIEIDNNNRITSFKEKSQAWAQGNINAGLYLLEKDVYLGATPAAKPFSIERDFFEKKLSELVISGFVFDGFFIDIGIPSDYHRAQDEFKGFKY